MTDLKERVLIVVPAWNEELSISAVICQLRKENYDVLVVDDGSTDLTRFVAISSGAVVASLPFNLGVGAALRCGFKYAIQNGYTVAVQCDADGQHPVEYIHKLLRALVDNDLDMVIGSRFLDKVGKMELSAIRRFAMLILAHSASRATKSKITDATSGFRAIRSPLLNELSMKLPPYYLGDTYEALVSAGRAGYQVREIPAPLEERTHGKSSAHPIKAAKLSLKAILSVVLHVHQKFDEPKR
jgi:glycosyltransferase involved in cell wall biosynthesis